MKWKLFNYSIMRFIMAWKAKFYKIIELYYGDESGFNLVPYIPYGWQEKGNPICIVPTKSKRVKE